MTAAPSLADIRQEIIRLRIEMESLKSSILLDDWREHRMHVIDQLEKNEAEIEKLEVCMRDRCTAIDVALVKLNTKVATLATNLTADIAAVRGKSAGIALAVSLGVVIVGSIASLLVLWQG